MNIKIDMWFDKDDGSSVRIDQIGDGWVYYVKWHKGSDEGRAERREIDDFIRAIGYEKMMPRVDTRP